MFQRAIVRPPAPTFADGLTTAELGVPDYNLALAQHAQYCAALEQCGLALTYLEPDERHPDSTFVEDTAILTKHGGIITRPGAASRSGEVIEMRSVLSRYFGELPAIEAPGTLDGGDICEADKHFFIGLSERTNEAGAQQLAAWLAEQGFTSTCIDIRSLPGLLHLKSGIAYLGDQRLVLIDALADHPAFQQYDVMRVPRAEAYAANCVRVNDAVLVAAGFPLVADTLTRIGYEVITLDMSEYQKMDGGLSCLSLRF